MAVKWAMSVEYGPAVLPSFPANSPLLCQGDEQRQRLQSLVTLGQVMAFPVDIIPDPVLQC